MGFDIYRVRPLESNRFALRRARSLPMGGTSGFFAKFLPSLANPNENWELSALEVLKLAESGAEETHRLFFDLTSNSPEKLNLLEVIAISGRTVSLITDAVFRFQVACSGAKRAEMIDAAGDLILPSWHEGPHRIEQLRLEGGTRGGTWAWSEPPQGATAAVLGHKT